MIDGNIINVLVEQVGGGTKDTHKTKEENNNVQVAIKHLNVKSKYISNEQETAEASRNKEYMAMDDHRVEKSSEKKQKMDETP